jgi:hypothetical protein
MQGSCFRVDFILFIVIDILKRNAEKAEVIRSDDPVPDSKSIKRCGKKIWSRMRALQAFICFRAPEYLQKIMRKERSQTFESINKSKFSI